jgi:hypothetical protein
LEQKKKRGPGTYDEARLLDVARKLSVLGEEPVAGMDHVDLVREGNLDDLIAREVCAHGCVLAPVSDLVGLVGLLPVHAEAVLMRVDRHGVQ